jgi:hypothetical protein
LRHLGVLGQPLYQVRTEVFRPARHDEDGAEICFIALLLTLVLLFSGDKYNPRVAQLSKYFVTSGSTSGVRATTSFRPSSVVYSGKGFGRRGLGP